MSITRREVERLLLEERKRTAHALMAELDVREAALRDELLAELGRLETRLETVHKAALRATTHLISKRRQ